MYKKTVTIEPFKPFEPIKMLGICIGKSRFYTKTEKYDAYIELSHCVHPNWIFFFDLKWSEVLLQNKSDITFEGDHIIIKSCSLEDLKEVYIPRLKPIIEQVNKNFKCFSKIEIPQKRLSYTGYSQLSRLNDILQF